MESTSMIRWDITKLKSIRDSTHVLLRQILLSRSSVSTQRVNYSQTNINMRETMESFNKYSRQRGRSYQRSREEIWRHSQHTQQLQYGFEKIVLLTEEHGHCLYFACSSGLATPKIRQKTCMQPKRSHG